MQLDDLQTPSFFTEVSCQWMQWQIGKHIYYAAEMCTLLMYFPPRHVHISVTRSQYTTDCEPVGSALPLPPYLPTNYLPLHF